MTVKKGDKVSVNYEGRLETGEIFDSSTHGDHSHPLEFEVGAGMVIPGFENGVLGMKINEEKEITIKPEQAYGMPDSRAIHKVPKAHMPKGQEPRPGMMLMMQDAEGHQIPAKIASVEKDTVTIDLNHPLAGKTLIFKIKLMKIN